MSPLLVLRVLAVTEGLRGKSWADFPFSARLGGDSSEVIPETWLHCLLSTHRWPLFHPVQVPRVHGPLTPSLLFWQKQNRQDGASSAHRAGRIELYGFQHPVEDAKASQAPHRWVHCEYLGTGFCSWVRWDNRVLLLIFAPPWCDLLPSAPHIDHWPLLSPEARRNVSCSRSFIRALKVIRIYPVLPLLRDRKI